MVIANPNTLLTERLEHWGGATFGIAYPLKPVTYTTRNGVLPHAIRRCFATHLLDNGMDVRFLQELLGHKDLTTSMIYTHITTKTLESIQSPLDQLSLGDNR